MDRRAALGGLMLGLAAPFAAVAAPERGVGQHAADAFLNRPDFMLYEVGEVKAVHYAEVASAYGAARLAAATGDRALFERVAQRHAKLLASGIGNSANHVDVNVYGVWPLELHRWTSDPDALARGLSYADGQWANPRPDGLSAQTRFWIDDIWMIGALQLQAWRTTGRGVYLDRAAHTAQAYVERLQQPNGLIHHGPDAPFFWGRGNGWVAAGLAEVLSALPKDHPRRKPIVAGYRRMMAALLEFQAGDGMWRQLIDREDAWKETSATAMFGFAMTVGVRQGVLGGAYHKAAEWAWEGLTPYVGADGRVSEICVGTGQSKEADYYLNRPRIVGDLHGQAPLMWFAAAREGAWDER